MKSLLLTLLCFFHVAVFARTFYTSPSGNDNNTGTITSPFFTLNKAWTVIVPGDTVYMRGGTYQYTIQQYLVGKNGAANNMIYVWAYPGETPVITKALIYTNNYYRGGCYFKGNYFHFKGIEITGFAQLDTYIWNGLLVDNANYNVFEQLNVHHNGSGMFLQGTSTGNLVLNSDFHHNYDIITGGGNADGFNIAFCVAGTSNTVRGCRSWWNSDDGIDFFSNDGYVLAENCWSWYNGYFPDTFVPTGDGQGFKLGSTVSDPNTILRTLKNNVSFKNLESGFHVNGARCRMEFYNNTSYDNGVIGFYLDNPSNSNIYKNNIGINNRNHQSVLSQGITSDHNSYGGNGVADNWANNASSADFVSLSMAGVDGPRQADGSLPQLGFLHLAPASDLIDAGTNVGTSYTGNAPDIGAYEYGSVPGNIAPIANAGPDQNATLPISIITLNGSGTDADGTIASYQWRKISGSALVTISLPGQASTTIISILPDVYKFELKVTDNLGAVDTDTVTVSFSNPNQLPTANAGANQTITLPNTVTVNGSGTDPDGSIASYLWTKINGPSANIVSPAQASTVINNLSQGVYQFELRVTDNQGATGKDTVTITVNPAPNQAPTANAGINQNITLPASSVTVNGSGNDPDGSIASYQWTKITGAAANIVSPTTSSTVINGLVQGVYEFELRVTDNQGAIGKDTVTITVNAVIPNQAPTANAGINQNITLPTSSVTLNGSGNDPDGSIASYQWTKITGAVANIVSPTTSSTVINGLVQGVYEFELRVTDNQGAIGKDTVTITVNAVIPNQAPTANAGINQNITLPTNSVTVTGSGNDPDGSIASYQWTKITGAVANIVSPTTSSTVINGLVQGVYEFELRVTDNQGAIGKDTVTITVNAAIPNLPPTANAGINQNITLPTSSVTVNGSGMDPDGSIASYQWTKITGAVANIVSPTASSTVINGLVQGVYEFELKVTDNQGAIGKDTVTITVNAAISNLPPTANAGINQNITLPTNSVTVNGSGNDPDGAIVSYQWIKIAGPGANIITPTQASTVINTLTQGAYQFELRVTDNQGAIGKDTITITVNGAIIPNQAPTANAGINQNITIPASSVTLNGSGTDPDGTIVSYQWTKIAGPGANIITPTQASTVINTLTQGAYQFELKVTDNQGAIGKDTVTITVNASTPNQAPVVNAGADQIITLPNSSVTLTGNAVDVDGIITSYSWTKISGPSANIVSATTSLTGVNGLTEGNYQFKLEARDNNGAIGTDIVAVTVKPAALVNSMPLSKAGNNKTIVLPVSTVTLEGSGTDLDGVITSYSWRVIKSPSTSFQIIDSKAAATEVIDLTEGAYEFELKVTDNAGGSALDTVGVEVRKSIGTQLSAYPNPVISTTTLIINMPSSSDKSVVEIYNMAGKLVHKEGVALNLGTATRTINLEKLRSGTYIIRVTSGKIKASTTLVKQ